MRFNRKALSQAVASVIQARRDGIEDTPVIPRTILKDNIIPGSLNSPTIDNEQPPFSTCGEEFEPINEII